MVFCEQTQRGLKRRNYFEGSLACELIFAFTRQLNDDQGQTILILSGVVALRVTLDQLFNAHMLSKHL